MSDQAEKLRQIVASEKRRPKIIVVGGTKSNSESRFFSFDFAAALEMRGFHTEVSNYDSGLGNCCRGFAPDSKNALIIMDIGKTGLSGLPDYIAGAEEAVILTAAGPYSAIEDYRTIKGMVVRNPNVRIYLVVNVDERQGEGYAVFEHLSAVAKRFLGISLIYLGEIAPGRSGRGGKRGQKLFPPDEPGCGISQDVIRIAENFIRYINKT